MLNLIQIETLEFTIKKIRLRELSTFKESSLYKGLDVIPISTNRIESYVNNPRANEEDVVLYLAFEDEKLVAFRTIFADSINILQNQYKFGWFSGNWVHNNYRRKGISTLLLNEVMSDWDSKLLYTNYAPNSKQLYDKSNKFDLFLEKQGMRLYFTMQLEALLTPRHPFFQNIKILLRITDWGINILLYPFRKMNALRFKKWLKPAIIEDKLTDKQKEYLFQNNNSIFKRSEPEYNWIFNYPWITEKIRDNAFYPFSSHANRFYYKFLSVDNGAGEICGLAIIKYRDGKITTPYFNADKRFEHNLSMALIAFCYKEKAKLLTSYSPEFLASLKNRNGIAFLRKDMSQKYFITKSFKNALPLNEVIISAFDGDGDYIFT